MSAMTDTRGIMGTMKAHGIELTFAQVNTLRRAALTLHRWNEKECGDGNKFISWSIERDDITGKPFQCIYYPHSGKATRYAIPDREAGALRRVKAICEGSRIHYFHQTDPRGCALYVSSEPLTDTNYSGRGVAVA